MTARPDDLVGLLADVREAQERLARVTEDLTSLRDEAMARARQAGISHKLIGDAAGFSDANVIKILRRREETTR